MHHGEHKDHRDVLDNELTSAIIGCAIEVHKQLGPGLLESAYEACLVYELSQSGYNVERQKPMLLEYKNISLECGYRLDLWVEDKVIVEIKAVENLLPVHDAQLLAYLKLAKCKLGLIVNFNEKLLKNGIRRFVL